LNLIDERRYSELLQRSRNLEDEAAMQKFLELIRDAYDLQHMYFAVLAKNPSSFASAFGTYPEAWRTYYRDHNLFSVDPVFTRSLEQPTMWENLAGLSETEHAVMREREKHGIGPHGMTIPITNTNGDVALLSLTGGDVDAQTWFKRAQVLLRELRDIGLILLTAYMESKGAKPAAVELSQRHLECIRLLGHGMSVDDIARFQGTTKKTTSNHIREAKARLHARTNSQLIYNAIQLGFLEV
jgi:DNA-binding CsgD family transcriptional regulator